MWIVVFFDLPTLTKTDTRNYRRFVDVLEKDGFARFQFSIFLRHCASAENAEVHMKRVRTNLPPKGHVVMLRVTDKQFGMMELFVSNKPEKPPEPVQQLELF